MRKVIWCGVALLVGVATTMLLAARYAANHPESFVARCALAVVEMGARINPLMVFRHDHLVLADKPGGIPGPEVLDNQGQAQAEQPVIDEPIVIEGPVNDDAVAVQTPEPARAEEEECCVDFIPLAKPDEENPAFMPYAADDDAADEKPAVTCPACGCLARLLGRLLGADNHDQNLSACAELAQSLAEILQTMTDEENQDNDPAEPAGLAPDGFTLEQNPEPEALPADEAAQESPSEEMPVEEMEDENPIPDQNTGAEKADTDEKMQEDNSPPQNTGDYDRTYHHDYPCCPYTGKCYCPYPYSYTPPAVTPVEHPEGTLSTPPAEDKAAGTEQPSPDNPSSGATNEEPSAPKEQAGSPQGTGRPQKFTGHWLIHKLLLLKESWESYFHPDIDTMECRPTDLQGDHEESGPY